jgi:hypothetical protein
VTDQIVLGVRQRQQAFALGGGQDGTTRHISIDPISSIDTGFRG